MVNNHFSEFSRVKDELRDGGLRDLNRRRALSLVSFGYQKFQFFFRICWAAVSDRIGRWNTFQVRTNSALQNAILLIRDIRKFRTEKFGMHAVLSQYFPDKP